MDFFTRELGTAQGRIQPTQVPADHGDYAVCLGSDLPRRFATLKGSDAITLLQSNTSSARFLRPKLHLRPAASGVPAGCAWYVEFNVEGAAVFEAILDRPRDLSDVAAVLLQYAPNPMAVEFRLRFEGPPGYHEVELPAYYVDALFEEAAGGAAIQLINRLPERNEVRVPRATTIRIDITTDSAAGPSLSGTTITVNGEVAYDNGGIMPEWDGPDSSVTARDGGRTQRIVLDPSITFASQSIVEVRVRSKDIATGALLDETYNFTIEDYTPPAIVSAVGVDLDRVRVKLAETVRTSEALDPANWVFSVETGVALVGWGTYRTAPALPVNATGVTQIGPLTYEITTDHAMTQRAEYRITATGVHDLAGNAMASPSNTSTFVSFDARHPDRELDLVRFVTRESIRLDVNHELRGLLWIWQESFELLFALVDRWLTLLDPDSAPEPFVDAMLQDLGNPFTFPLTLLQKRKLVGTLTSIYQQKGSAEGIVNAIRIFLGVEVTVAYQNFEGAGLGEAALDESFILAGGAFDAYAYEILVPEEVTDEDADKMRQIAEYMQAANEHLRKIVRPTTPPPGMLDHLVLGYSSLGLNWQLH